MTPQEIMVIISKLNSELYEQTENDYIYLDYSTNTYVEVIEFLGYPIWNSEFDEREYLDEEDEREDLEVYLRREINEFVKSISKIQINL